MTIAAVKTRVENDVEYGVEYGDLENDLGHVRAVIEELEFELSQLREQEAEILSQMDDFVHDD